MIKGHPDQPSSTNHCRTFSSWSYPCPLFLGYQTSTCSSSTALLLHPHESLPAPKTITHKNSLNGKKKVNKKDKQKRTIRKEYEKKEKEIINQYKKLAGIVHRLSSEEEGQETKLIAIRQFLFLVSLKLKRIKTKHHACTQSTVDDI